ncbi:hypothetical protein PSCFBP3800_05800 [Pseudomonas syringae group genomosp. 3]|uniref:Uncharacterized protein n=1 Tax=Pseudomonas syringae group genomosp. 3 TaxID=251701 RepID=A0A2K4WMC1_9PSED|nr:hypothetical protein ALQ62_00433 [Pseudomonas coronafaciens pv. zizaniae]SOS37053.1 hypothetical protein CFBP6411_05700 [Pseudomonas syringae group genomosp. 3]SPF21243.1 hypothetical protein PSCFBP3800_05800 [Pseudomonas syringae group genomosp. 3]
MNYVLLYLILPLGVLIRRSARFAHRPDPKAASYLKRQS